MTIFESLILGIVQGATEFLPVSSSGHLVVAQTLLDIHVEGVVFEVVVHLATLISILLVYRARVARLVQGAVRRDADALRYIGFLALATVPAGVVGVLWKHEVEALFENPVAPGIALLVTGAVLWTTRWALQREAGAEVGWGRALAMGLAQAVALVPGISRSGSTVVAGLWLRVDAEEAAAFSFLMAVPAIAGAAVLQIPEMGGAGGIALAPLLVGGFAAGVTGVLAIRTFVAMLARRSFHLFAPYCWCVGGGYLFYLALR
ncbi:MAG: undecaprenyl-diphosphate phosphatase [Gemmatimonadota bacterium]|nr:undecaprenyl-diphosphate phosphatase [Gemmatimonadota bacterium]